MLQIRNTILGLTFLLTYNVWSQTDKNGKIEAQEIIIIKDYKVNLEEAVKMNFSPKTPPSENFKKNKLSYNIPSKLKQLSFEPKPVQTLSFTKSVADKFTESYIKLGFGTQISPLIDILHNQKFSKDLNFKLGINHLSANRTDINMPWQRYFTNHLFTGLDYYGKKIIIKPRASFLYNHNNFYAPDLPVSPEGVSEIGRNYQIFSFQNNIITYTGKKGITFQNEIRGDLMKDNINNTTLDTAKKKYNEYRYGGDISIEKNFKNTHILQFKITADIAQTNNFIKSHRNIIGNQLKYNLDLPKIGFKLMAGLNYTYETRISHLLPLLETEKNLIGSKFIFFTGWNIKLQQSYYKDFIQNNPFLYYSGEIKNTKVDNRYAGFKGSIGKFNYNALFSNREIGNIPIYLTDSANSRLFHLAYETRLIINNLHLDANFKPNGNFDIFLISDVFLYETTLMKKAWNMPNVDISLGAKYKITPKLTLSSDIFLKQGINVQSSTGTAELVPIIIDFNVGGTYYLNKNFSIFLNLNNLASQKYRLWYGYPFYGAQAFAGIKFSY